MTTHPFHRATLVIDDMPIEYDSFSLGEDLQDTQRRLYLSLTVNRNRVIQKVLDILKYPRGRCFSFRWDNLLIEAKGYRCTSTALAASGIMSFELVLEEAQEEYKE